jgi:hypothetical protein
MQPKDARRAWYVIETVHAVTYFADESREAATGLGLKGFWMGYFAFRAAPMGEAPPGLVTATFFNFHQNMVRRALPDAWRLAPGVDAVLAARRDAATTSLRRLVDDAHRAEAQVAAATGGAAAEPDARAGGAADPDAVAERAVPLLDRVVEAADEAGRPLFATNRALPPLERPLDRLWQACTSLREHRGDGHVACLTAEGLDGCQVHVLFSAGEGVDPALLRESRGWSSEEWDDAAARLRRRGLLEGDALSDAGRELRARIERRTDELAIDPYHALSNAELDALLATLKPLARTIVASGTIRYPNPMGLPPLVDEP